MLVVFAQRLCGDSYRLVLSLSPVAPKFAFKEDIITFFHFMHMFGPSSKLTYCHAIQRFVKLKTPSIIVPDIYKPFLGVYSAWLQVQSQLHNNIERIISTVESLAPPSNDEIVSAEIATKVAVNNESQKASLNATISEWMSANVTAWNSIPLRVRCNGCFGGGTAQVGYLSFDGNFQHKRLSTRPNSQMEYGFQSMDKRMFIETLRHHLVLSIIYLTY
jgi:hypothetical protein